MPEQDTARLDRLEEVLRAVLSYQIRYDCFREESPEWFAEKDKLMEARQLMDARVIEKEAQEAVKT